MVTKKNIIAPKKKIEFSLTKNFRRSIIAHRIYYYTIALSNIIKKRRRIKRNKIRKQRLRLKEAMRRSYRFLLDVVNKKKILEYKNKKKTF